MIELGVADAAPPGGLSRVHPRPADVIGNVEEMKLMSRSGLFEQVTHPSP